MKNTGLTRLRYRLKRRSLDKIEKGDKSVALAMMKLAADMEDSTSKHPVTPGEVFTSQRIVWGYVVPNEPV